MLDSGAAPVADQSTVCLGPGRQLLRLLLPMRYVGLVTPPPEPRHGLGVSTGDHECSHRCAVDPHRLGPVRVGRLTEHLGCEIAWGTAGLLVDSDRIGEEGFEVLGRPHAEPGDRDERHRPSLSCGTSSLHHRLRVVADSRLPSTVRPAGCRHGDDATVRGVVRTGLLAGNELGTLIGFHPAIRALPLRSQIESERALTGRLGKIMPFYTGASLLTASVAAADRRGRRGFGLAMLAAGATAGMVIITLVAELPLNKRTVGYPLDGDAHEWSAIRRRWERFHQVRVALDLIAFGCLAAAALED